MRRAFVIVLVLTGSSAARPALAQEVALSVFGGIGQPRSTVVLAGGRERVRGIWAGGGIELEAGRFLMAVSGYRGELTPFEGDATFDRDAGEIGGRVGIALFPWIGLEGGFAARAFSAASGYQRWNIPSVGAVVSGTLGHPAIRAHFRVAYLPGVSVTGLESPDVGVAGSAGITVAPEEARFVARLEYGLERYDFPPGTTSRLEQFDQIRLSVGARLRVAR
ncbi:MAG TPA: hypothetical protein VGA37_14785 [Gemmatimonadales bacterium]